MVLDDYTVNGRKTKRRAEGCLKNLHARLGHLRARDMTLDRLNAYVAARLQDGAQPATIQNELATLKRAFHSGRTRGQGPAASLPDPPGLEHPHGLLRARRVPLGARGPPRAIQSLVEFAYLTGWRLGEILPLTWRQIDLKAGIIRLEPGSTKNDEGRSFPFRALPALAALIERQREATTLAERETKRIIPPGCSIGRARPFGTSGARGPDGLHRGRVSSECSRRRRARRRERNGPRVCSMTSDGRRSGTWSERESRARWP